MEAEYFVAFCIFSIFMLMTMEGWNKEKIWVQKAKDYLITVLVILNIINWILCVIHEISIKF